MKNAKIVKNETSQAIVETVLTSQELVLSALDVRLSNADNNAAREYFNGLKRDFTSITQTQINVLESLDLDFSALAEQIKLDKASNTFIAQKAIKKVFETMRALASNSSSYLDKYTFSIVKNLNTLQKLDNLNMQRSICSKIELDLLAQEQAIKVYHNCSPSTASTQASSTRMMLQFLNVCNVQKGLKSDAISFTGSQTSLVMQALFKA